MENVEFKIKSVRTQEDEEEGEKNEREIIFVSIRELSAAKTSL